MVMDGREHTDVPGEKELMENSKRAPRNRKLGRHFVGVEIDELYGCLAEKRLELATKNSTIQGYSGKVFWERNTLTRQKRDMTVFPLNGTVEQTLY